MKGKVVSFCFIMKRFVFTLSILLLFFSGALLHFEKSYLKNTRNPASVKNKQLEKIFENLKNYRQSGLIAQYDGDMGDTLQRTGSYYSLLYYLGSPTDDQDRPLSEGYNSDIEQLMVEPGYYRRSNKSDNWSSNPENCSRDQMISLSAAIVIFEDHKRGRELFLTFLSRVFFNQNVRNNDSYPGQLKYEWKIPDPPSPMQLSLLFRGVGSWIVYPAVFFLDIALLFDITVFRRFNSRELWDTDIKALPNIIAANSYLPTPWSKLAIAIYTDQRSDIENRIRNYNEIKYNGIPPLADIYILTLQQLSNENDSDYYFF